MTAVLISGELLLASRIIDAAGRAGEDIVRIGSPSDLPPAASVQLLLVDWSGRDSSWGDAIAEWMAAAPEGGRVRVVLFGPHTDLDAHAAARSAGLGPMWGRSKLVAELGSLFAPLSSGAGGQRSAERGE